MKQLAIPVLALALAASACISGADDAPDALSIAAPTTAPVPTTELAAHPMADLSVTEAAAMLKEFSSAETFSWRISISSQDDWDFGPSEHTEDIHRGEPNGPLLSIADYTSRYRAVVASNLSVHDLPEDAFEDFTPALLASAAGGAVVTQSVTVDDTTYVQYKDAVAHEFAQMSLFANYYADPQGLSTADAAQFEAGPPELGDSIASKWIATSGRELFPPGLGPEAQDLVWQLTDIQPIHLEVETVTSGAAALTLFNMDSEEAASLRAQGRFVPSVNVMVAADGSIVSITDLRDDRTIRIESIEPVAIPSVDDANVLTETDILNATGLPAECLELVALSYLYAHSLTPEDCEPLTSDQGPSVKFDSVAEE